MYIHVCACESVAVVMPAAAVVSPLSVVAVYHKNIKQCIINVIIVIVNVHFYCVDIS